MHGADPYGFLLTQQDELDEQQAEEAVGSSVLPATVTCSSCLPTFTRSVIVGVFIACLLSGQTSDMKETSGWIRTCGTNSRICG